jgi:hypothetical protein
VYAVLDSSDELIFEYGPPLAVPRYTLYPTTSDPLLASHVNATLCWAAAVPTPVNDCVVGELAASLPNDNVPVAVPAAAGSKVTVKEALCPALRVTGNEIPDSVNSLLSMLAEEMVTDVFAAVTVPLSESLAPTATFPKLRLVGETDSSPWAVPIPDSGMLNGELSAVETTLKLPLIEPVPLGANVTVNVRLWLGSSAVGKLGPLIEKLEPLIFAAETVTASVPLFVTVSERLAVLPFCTLPKEIEDDDAMSEAVPAGGGELLRDTP